MRDSSSAHRLTTVGGCTQRRAGHWSSEGWQVQKVSAMTRGSGGGGWPASAPLPRRPEAPRNARHAASQGRGTRAQVTPGSRCSDVLAANCAKAFLCLPACSFRCCNDAREAQSWSKRGILGSIPWVHYRLRGEGESLKMLGKISNS